MWAMELELVYVEAVVEGGGLYAVPLPWGTAAPGNRLQMPPQGQLGCLLRAIVSAHLSALDRKTSVSSP